MIASNLLAELACVLPGPGYQARQAVRPIDVDDEAAPIVESMRETHAPAIGQRNLERRRAEWIKPETRERMSIVLDTIRRDGPCTVADARRRLRVLGYDMTEGQVQHALDRLELERQLRSHVLRNQRDIERAGGRRLWQISH